MIPKQTAKWQWFDLRDIQAHSGDLATGERIDQRGLDHDGTSRDVDEIAAPTHVF